MSERFYVMIKAVKEPFFASLVTLQPARTLIFAVVSVLFCTIQVARSDVLINEFLADNESGLRTAAGDTADWIELVNTGPAAVDLSGWHLTDDAAVPTKWSIPEGTIIQPNDYLLIFADSSPVSSTNDELHANFSLSKEGEYLALFRPDGLSVASQFTPSFPPQRNDISYGRGSPPERELIGRGTPCVYRVPNSGGTASWISGLGALGFTGTEGSFTVRYYEMNGSIDNIDMAEAMVADSSYWKTDRTYPIVGQYQTFDFHGTSGSGYFHNDVLFPGHDYVGEDRETFVLVADGAILVPSAGMWTFAVGSDDGFRLRIKGHGVEFVSEYTTGRAFGNTLATFNFPVAGVYDLSLIFYENYGGASVEFSVAQGFQETLSTDVFHLTGDPAGGVIHAGAIGSMFETDVGGVMKDQNARLDAEWTFTLPEPPAPGEAFTLYVRCADGFSASLNGTPVASLNVPVPLQWNSSATSKRSVDSAVQWLSYPLNASLIVPGLNTLALTGLNDSPADPDFLLSPRLGVRSAQTFLAYFKTPTPGEANAEAYTAPTPVVTTSEPRGYKTNPFSVSLTCPSDPAAEIRYTLDGTTPGTNSAVYTSPLYVSQTTTLRAAVVIPGTIHQNVSTVTWLFLEDILQQSQSPPPGWPGSWQVNNHVMEYGLRQEIVTGDPVRLRNGMTNAIPSISLVTDLDNLFSPQRGIYVNPGNDGIAWERPVSIELIDPVKGSASEFHIDGGVRIRGAYSRSSGNPKHAFRLFFRSEYGEGKLHFRLFGDEGAAEFDKIDLRTSQNYSWAFENSGQETFVRETFSRDSQRDMGMPYTRSRYYHLYLNGQYWGLYQTQERGEADYAATYLGGANEDWDCIKTSQPGYVTTASDGTFDAFYALHDIAINQGFTGAYSNNYFRLKGFNPDGTRNPAFPVYLDEDNLIVYMLVAYYTGDPDSPVSIWGGFPNNMYGLFNRVDPDGFKWLRHDAEHSLGSHAQYGVTCDTTMAGSSFTGRWQFNPAILHQRLCQHPVYRLRFADLVQKHLYGTGALTPTNAQQRFLRRMNEIDLAIIGESARWGRGKTRDGNWLPTCNLVVNGYLAQRRDIIVGHFRTRGWFPSLNAPSYSIMNTEVPSGRVVRVSGNSTFYYTTNGSDPRLPDGRIHPAAVAVAASANFFADLTVTNDITIMARSFNGVEWSALSENVLTVQRPPPDYSSLRISEFSYAPPAPPLGSPYVDDDFAWIEMQNTGLAALDLKGVSFANGITHTFGSHALAPGGRLVLAKNPSAFATIYPTNNIKLIAWASGNLARSGERLAMISPETNNILTFTYSRLWYPETYDAWNSLVAVDLGAPEPLWSTAGNWRPSRVPFGTPGLAEPPQFGSARLTAEGLLTMEVYGLEGTVNLWLSDDLATWVACDPGAWSRTNNLFSVNLKHSSLAAKPRCFFQLRLGN